MGGEEVFENERYSAHLLFLRLMLDYTPEWRDIHLFGAGYREDTEGNACKYEGVGCEIGEGVFK